MRRFSDGNVEKKQENLLEILTVSMGHHDQPLLLVMRDARKVSQERALSDVAVTIRGRGGMQEHPGNASLWF